MTEYIVHDGQGRLVTGLRVGWHDEDGQPVWVWRTDTDQPAVRLDWDTARAFVVHIDPDAAGAFTIREA